MSNIVDWKRDELFYLFSRRTNGKEKENYIVNAIWHKINNMELQPVTQQCIVKEDGKHYLIDLYFPQINYGIECDEGHHKNIALEDKKRELEIEHVLSSIDGNFKLERIDATLSIKDINNKIDKIVIEINEKINGKRVNWKSVEERIEEIIDKKELCCSDQISFPTEAKAASCFNKNAKNYQKSYFSLNDEYQIWFPKLAIEKSNGEKKAASKAGWINELSKDCKNITEYNDGRTLKKEDAKKEKKRITFAQSKDVYGKRAYRFIGVFQYEKTDNDGRDIYIRKADRIDLKPFFI